MMTGKKFKFTYKLFIPLFWYLLFTIAVPLLNNDGLYREKNFIEHSLYIVVISLIIIALFRLWALLKEKKAGTK